MSKCIKDCPTNIQTQFYGGEGKGTCLQVTMKDTMKFTSCAVFDSIQLTKAQALDLSNDLAKWARS